MERIKILLVDDEMEFVKTLAERIQIRGFDVRYAFDGEAALAACHDSLPDVMVLDLKMPGMDGLEVLRRIRKSHPDIPVLILTGHGSDRDEMEARRLGAFDYLQKPVAIDVLIEQIRQAGRSRIGTCP